MKLALLGVLLALCACARPQPSDRFEALYREIHPSVVFLTMKAPSDDPKMHGKIDDAYGSAFVVESGDWGTRVITAKHVIDGARNVKARIGDAAGPQSVRIIAQDEREDLALLEVRTIKNVRAAVLGDSRTVVPGETVALLGYPIPDAFIDEGLGTAASLYTGHVASVRDAGTPDETIELDLPVIPGESGAPVFTSDGKVIGLAESRFDEEHAIGFATPASVIGSFLAAHARTP
jgi:S1-C subfamily serine protease